MEKLSLEKFLEIKKRLLDAVEELSNEYADVENEEELYKSIRERYLPIQAELYDYDLSDIPFEAWEDIAIVGLESDIADFSKTKANIDFNLVGCDGYTNFKGCNLRNIDQLFGNHYPKMFDEEVVKSSNSYFLSDIFSDEFKDKYYNGLLDIADLSALSKEQISELNEKKWKLKLKSIPRDIPIIDLLQLEKVIELYNISQEEFYAVNKIIEEIRYRDIREFNSFLKQINEIDVNQIKDKCFETVRNILYNSNNAYINMKELPEMFKKENSDLYLESVNIPDEIREKYFSRRLSLEDFLKYSDAFKNINIDNFMRDFFASAVFSDFGPGVFQKLCENHRDFLEHINEYASSALAGYFRKNTRSDAESTFIAAAKELYLDHFNSEGLSKIEHEDGSVEYALPSWVSSLNFIVKENIKTVEDLLDYNDHILLGDIKQLRLLNSLGINNIKKFDEETGFFTGRNQFWSNPLSMFDAFCYFMGSDRSRDFRDKGIDFKNGELSYENFRSMMAKTLDFMRSRNIFTDYPDYDWLSGKFRDEYPEIFMDSNVPYDLKNCFYHNRITPEYLYMNKDAIKYLIDKDLTNTIRASIDMVIAGADVMGGGILPYNVNFIKEYAARYGNEKTLNLIAKYGSILSDISINSLKNEIDNEKEIEKAIQKAIYSKIHDSRIDYSYLENVPDFVNAYPNMFIDIKNMVGVPESERYYFKSDFYSGNMDYDYIKKNPEIIPYIKDKDLFIAFRRKITVTKSGRLVNGGNMYINNNPAKYSEFELALVYGNEKFLELCSKYGKYINNITNYLYESVSFQDNKLINNKDGKELNFEEILYKIEEIIKRECRNGNIQYNDVDAPEFLRRDCPDLFLSSDAPYSLKNYFYGYSSLDFNILKNNKEWLQYLNGKSIKTALLRSSYYKEELRDFFQLFGDETAIKLGINKAETVCKMLNDGKVELMKKWYDKTGGRFIPDYIVMQNFSIEEADKFLTSGSNWSTLMKIKRFANNPDGRDAMLKLAYSFGAFDHDQRGFKKIIELLTDIPRKISAEYGYIIDDYSSMIENAKRLRNGDQIDKDIAELTGSNLYLNLIEAMEKEKVNIDYDKPILEQIYRKNEDGSYSLTINPQMYPKTTEIIRDTLESTHVMRILDSTTAHRYFGGFKMEYDPDFREFFLENYDKIMNDVKYLSQIATIQRRFKEIKTVYSNVVLTLDLAISYINDNRYEFVNPGDERVTKIAAIQGYSQEEFNKIQRIYNYGKQRVFSSIPRVESKEYVELKTGKYHYEMLRLDDPRAMSIGYESDCCQRLGEPAEMCMEHSMVDKNGRVFVITNELGEVVAQSWVWRNKDVLCFDNIEVPDQKMWDNGIPRGSEDSGIRNDFTDDILTIYTMAAHELIEEDERVYRDLLESGKITQEQYEGLRLGKITTGEGYSNIKGSLRTLPVDKGDHATPLAFSAPVKLIRGLYSDASIQYIIEKRGDRKEYNGDTPVVHADSYIEYDDTNFTENQVHALERLESITKDQPYYLDTSVGRNVDKTKLVSAIARNYGLHQETTKIILHPNFAIIYDTYGDKITIGDLLFNTKIDNFDQQMDIEDKVIMQIRLALNQIASGKEVVLLEPTEKQQLMYEKIMGLKNEMDIERGVGYVR